MQKLQERELDISTSTGEVQRGVTHPLKAAVNLWPAIKSDSLGHTMRVIRRAIRYVQVAVPIVCYSLSLGDLPYDWALCF